MVASNFYVNVSVVIALKTTSQRRTQIRFWRLQLKAPASLISTPIFP